MKVLIIEDNYDLTNCIKEHLIADSFMVDVAYDGNRGSYMARTNPYDVIVIDYTLPAKNGLAVCEEIRAAEIETPILFLTVTTDLRKKITVLEKGADDYMTKPFSLEELKTRIHVLARRPRRLESPLLVVDDLVLNTKSKTVHRGSKSIYLTRKTYNLLEYLMRNRGMVMSRGAIMEYVWNSESDPLSNTVEAHILALRKKINIDGKKDIVRNIAGRGYIIDP